MTPRLPIEEALPALKEVLAANRAAVVEAPPGAGKTTLVPLALKDEAWLEGRSIVMLEPRRVAARAAAIRMAHLSGESVGETVGYRIRLESRVGPRTRIEVLTEGLLTRRLQNDPGLSGVGLVIFDEFHERSLVADQGLAFALETQGALNEDLRILVMSATLDGARVAKLLGGAPIVRSEGRLYPIETRYLRPQPSARLEQTVATAVNRALAETDGDVLVFLPGEGEIRNAERALAEDTPRGVAILPLYGALSSEAQDRALRPAPLGERKIVLATSIAETSLTIEGVRTVIDSGLQRLPRYDPATGLTRLVTQRVSLASADQRRGRAGRIAPGICIRLWDEPETRSLAPFTPPEILTSDLAPFALDLALWGVRDPATLALLDPPPSATFAEAQELLRELDALDAEGGITAHGRAMAGFGAHPRLAHMMLRGRDREMGATAAALAAILGERDVVRTNARARDADLRLRLEAFAGTLDTTPDVSVDRGALARAREQARVWRRTLGVKDDVDPALGGRLAALAYPDRIAKRRARGSFRLTNGRGATLPESDPLAAEDYLAIAALDGAGANARIQQAAPLTAEDIDDLFGGHVETQQVIAWDSRERAVVAREEDRLGVLVLSERKLSKPDPDQVAAAVLTGIREQGLKALPWTQDLETLRARAAFVRKLDPDGGWPDLSDENLAATLDRWLQPFLSGITRAADFARIDLSAAIASLFDWQQKTRLDTLAPTHIEVPSGSRIAVDYGGETPVLAVRLQELFGLAETPSIGGGRVPLTLHLLSPARRPVQVTRDLRSFWSTTYQEVKRDLKGRYPKHHWPDDPWTAVPTARAKPRSG